MKLNRMMGILNISLTTTPTAVVIPEKYKGVGTLLIGAHLGDELIQWRRQASATATESKLCPAEDIGIALNIDREQTIFYAKTTTGTGTLEIELWQ